MRRIFLLAALCLCLGNSFPPRGSVQYVTPPITDGLVLLASTMTSGQVVKLDGASFGNWVTNADPNTCGDNGSTNYWDGLASLNSTSCSPSNYASNLSVWASSSNGSQLPEATSALSYIGGTVGVQDGDISYGAGAISPDYALACWTGGAGHEASLRNITMCLDGRAAALAIYNNGSPLTGGNACSTSACQYKEMHHGGGQLYGWAARPSWSQQTGSVATTATYVNGGNTMTVAACPVPNPPYSWVQNGSATGIPNYTQVTSSCNAIPITSVTNNGSGLCRVTTPYASLWTTGASVTVSDPNNTSCAGTFTITVIDSSHFDEQGSTFSGSSATGGTISSSTTTLVLAMLNGVTATASETSTAIVINEEYWQGPVNAGLGDAGDDLLPPMHVYWCNKFQPGTKLIYTGGGEAYLYSGVSPGAGGIFDASQPAFTAGSYNLYHDSAGYSANGFCGSSGEPNAIAWGPHGELFTTGQEPGCCGLPWYIGHWTLPPSTMAMNIDATNNSNPFNGVNDFAVGPDLFNPGSCTTTPTNTCYSILFQLHSINGGTGGVATYQVATDLEHSGGSPVMHNYSLWSAAFSPANSPLAHCFDSKRNTFDLMAGDAVIWSVKETSASTFSGTTGSNVPTTGGPPVKYTNDGAFSGTFTGYASTASNVPSNVDLGGGGLPPSCMYYAPADGDLMLISGDLYFFKK